VEEESYSFLKAKVKNYMPDFIEHVKNLFRDYCEKAFMKDREEI
jgi:hypothetical protein